MVEPTTILGIRRSHSGQTSLRRDELTVVGRSAVGVGASRGRPGVALAVGSGRLWHDDDVGKRVCIEGESSKAEFYGTGCQRQKFCRWFGSSDLIRFLSLS